MSRNALETVEDVVRRSRYLNGCSRIVNSKMFPLQSVRPNRQAITPLRALSLKGRRLAADEVKLAMQRHNLEPANLAELLQYVEDGLWDGYTSLSALGQSGKEDIYGKSVEYVPYLWGAGGIHHLGGKSLADTWSDSDYFLVIPR